MTVIKDNLWIGWQVRNLRVGHRLGKKQAQRISVVLSFSTVPKTLICFISRGCHKTNFTPSLKKKIVSLVPRTLVEAPPKNCICPLRPRDFVERPFFVGKYLLCSTILVLPCHIDFETSSAWTDRKRMQWIESNTEQYPHLRPWYCVSPPEAPALQFQDLVHHTLFCDVSQSQLWSFTPENPAAVPTHPH